VTPSFVPRSICRSRYPDPQCAMSTALVHFTISDVTERNESHSVEHCWPIGTISECHMTPSRRSRSCRLHGRG
jgi:hypothetical protein